MITKINEFFSAIQKERIELYNEAGLQHELALFLRTKYSDLEVWLEYPSKRIVEPVPEFVKKEIDLYVKNSSGQSYVIELKMPKQDSAVPSAMYKAIEDVKSLEILKENQINGCFAILITNKSSFWGPTRSDAGIYQMFNGAHVNIGDLTYQAMPEFLHGRREIQLKNRYEGKWVDYIDLNNCNWKYYVLSV